MDGDFEARWMPFAGFAGIARRHWNIEGKRPEHVPGTPEYLLEAATSAIKALDALYSETIHWNDQIHALDHLLGREHPRYDDERQRLLIATGEC
jgi:hypothetical protein